MGWKFDLLGDPVPANHGLPGRPEHAASPESVSKVKALLVARWTLEAIAAEIGVSVPTLKKHYFGSGRVDAKRMRQVAIAQVQGRVILQLMGAAEEGSVSAMKELRKLTEAAALTDLPAKMQPTAAPVVEGKKALKKRAAKKPTKGWAELGLPGIPN